MKALVMAGGRGTRMHSKEEKLLLEINGEAMVLRTIRILVNSKLFDSVLCLTSPNSSKTAIAVKNTGTQIVPSLGVGYSKDLGNALSNLDGCIFVISADMPLVDSSLLQQLISLHDSNSAWTSYVMSKKFANSLDMQYPDAGECNGVQCVHTGAMIINASSYAGIDQHVHENFVIVDDKKLGTNINTKSDYENLVCIS